MIPYNNKEFVFLSPPRPEVAIPPARLSLYEKKGQWVGQAKMNGTYSEIGISPDRKITCKKRDGSDHSRWSFSLDSSKAFLSLPGRGWYVFCCELLNDKTKHIKDTNFLHDMIVEDGQMLTGLTYPERYERLCALFPTTDKTGMGYSVINDHLWLANVFTAPFGDTYRRLIQADEVEGLVLKSTSTKLSLGNPSKGQIKCRRPHKNYSF